MVNKTEKLDNKEYVSVRACIMFSCLLYGDYYIHVLSFRMKIADNKTSQGILHNAKVISAVSQVCKNGDTVSISLHSERWRGIGKVFRDAEAAS